MLGSLARTSIGPLDDPDPDTFVIVCSRLGWPTSVSVRWLGWVPGGSNTIEPEEMGQEPWGFMVLCCPDTPGSSGNLRTGGGQQVMGPKDARRTSGQRAKCRWPWVTYSGVCFGEAYLERPSVRQEEHVPYSMALQMLRVQVTVD